jgi:hypothetical protein
MEKYSTNFFQARGHIFSWRIHRKNKIGGVRYICLGSKYCTVSEKTYDKNDNKKIITKII